MKQQSSRRISSIILETYSELLSTPIEQEGGFDYCMMLIEKIYNLMKLSYKEIGKQLEQDITELVKERNDIIRNPKKGQDAIIDAQIMSALIAETDSLFKAELLELLSNVFQKEQMLGEY